jgi:hypothetical protein
MKKIAHAVDEIRRRLLATQRHVEQFRMTLNIRELAPEVFRQLWILGKAIREERIGVAIFTAARNLGATRNRVPNLLRPFDV